MNTNNKFWRWLFQDKGNKVVNNNNDSATNKVTAEDIAIMTNREVMLRYSNAWKAIFFFCLPTVVLMLVQGLYNILDKSLSLEFATEHAMANWKYITMMIDGSGNGQNSVLLGSLQNLYDLNGGSVTPIQIEEMVAGLFEKNSFGTHWDDFISQIISNPNNTGQLLSWVENLGLNIQINEHMMKGYINITTQYTTQSYNLVYSFNQIMAIGAGMHYAMEFGKGNRKKLAEISGNGLTFSLLMSIIIAMLLFTVSFRPWGQALISSQMGSDRNLIVEELAWKDVEPLIYGLSILFVANFCMNMLRSEGKMIHIMIMTISSLGVKLVVSIVLMHYLGMELTGAQMGTVAAYLYQLIYSLIVMFKSKVSYSKFRFEHLYKLHIHNYTYSLKAGLPNFIMYFAIFINVYVSTAVVIHLPVPESIPGELAKEGGISITQRFLSSLTPWNEFILSACIGLNQGTRTIVAFNYGAKNNIRITDIVKKSFLLMFVWMLFILALIISAGPSMLQLFEFPDAGIAYGSTFYWYLIIYFITYPLAGFTYISLSLFQGTKKTLIATWTSSLRSLTVFLPLVGIGYLLAIKTQNPLWYFLMIGLTDLIVAMLIIPLIYAYYKRTKDANKFTKAEEPITLKISYAKYLVQKDPSVENQEHLDNLIWELNK
ncbi:MATE family efflux transporter [[Acholeplasma] multilocale]|uniref:MATE family efflux transporter n=1 Tax=[Acholeplasma] multilocale TaxID=264638 RepID=UPI00047C0771|nr:MATE family efflux transporter [[Acholeplasma] multilocale]